MASPADINFTNEGFSLDRKGQFQRLPPEGGQVRVLLTKRRGIHVAKKMAELGPPASTMFDPRHPYHVLIEWRFTDNEQVDRCLEILTEIKVKPAASKPGVAEGAEGLGQVLN